MSMEVPFPLKILIMDVFMALFQDRVQELVVELMSVVEGVQGSVPGQSSPALGRADVRGQVLWPARRRAWLQKLRFHRDQRG